MIGVALLSMLQAAAAEPAPASQLRRAETTIMARYAMPDFPEEVWPIVSEYQKCLNPKEGLRSEGVAGFESAVRARMQACRPTRGWAVGSALTVYKSDRKQPGTAQEQVAKLFDDFDVSELRNAKYVDEQFRAQMGLPPAADQSAPAKAGDAQNR